MPWRSCFRSFCVPILLGLMAACGGGGSSPTTPATQPAASNPTRSVLVTKNFSLNAGTATFQNVDLPPAGTLDATVDWNGNNDVNLYVTDNTCPGFVDLKAGGCNVVAKADGTAKPERLTFTTTAGRIWTFWIYNNGSSSESGAMEVGITSDTQPAPAPTPTPTSGGNDPRSGLAPGPVVRYTIKVRTIDKGNFDYRDPFQDADGNWIVYPDEFVVFDSTQKNAAGDLCQWVRDPEWNVDDPTGVLHIRGSSQPFLLRTDVLKNKGTVQVQASIDGVKSNVLNVKAQKRP
jgi:hypothetical protein